MPAVEQLRRTYYGTYSKGFLEFFALLNAHSVNYTVVGGYAVAYHDAPTFTSAIDVLVGLPPMRIDILTGIDGVTSDQAWEQRLEVQIDNVLVHFISRELLIRNKRASGRTTDLADLERLCSG